MVLPWCLIFTLCERKNQTPKKNSTALPKAATWRERGQRVSCAYYRYGVKRRASKIADQQPLIVAYGFTRRRAGSAKAARHSKGAVGGLRDRDSTGGGQDRASDNC